MVSSAMSSPLTPQQEEISPPGQEIQSPALDLLPPPKRSKLQTWTLRLMAVALIATGVFFSQEGLVVLVLSLIHI